MERSEKFDLLYMRFKSGLSSYSDEEKGKQDKQRLEKTVHYPSIPRATNVFGIVSEPICDYLRCHHAFSQHGLRAGKCKCKHPQNAAIGA